MHPNSFKLTIVSAHYSPTGDLPDHVLAAIANHRSYASSNDYEYIFDTHNYIPPDTSYSNSMYIGCNAKPRILLHHIEECPADHTHLFMWIDSDSYFCNLKPLDLLLDKVNDFTFTGDLSDIINSGHLIFRNTVYSRHFLRSWIHASRITFDPSISPFPLTPNNYALGDQSIVSCLLGSGLDHLSASSLLAGFRNVNGFCLPEKSRLRYIRKYSPLDNRRCRHSYELLHKSLLEHVTILPQRALNSYLYGPLCGHYRPGDTLIHLVSGSKHYLPTASELDHRSLYRPKLSVFCASFIRSAVWSLKLAIKQFLYRLFM